MRASIGAQESYAERRKLFRNIWETALGMDQKEDKPKVIRTLRLDSDEKMKKSAARKKEKLRNLRHVCNKILDFCDKQEAEEYVFEDRIFGEAAADDLETEKAKRTKKNKKVRTLCKPNKIKYKHPEVPLAVGDYKRTRRRSPDKSLSSPPKFPSKKDLKSDYQFIHVNSMRHTSKEANRKVRIQKRKKVKKNKTKDV